MVILRKVKKAITSSERKRTLQELHALRERRRSTIIIENSEQTLNENGMLQFLNAHRRKQPRVRFMVPDATDASLCRRNIKSKLTPPYNSVWVRLKTGYAGYLPEEDRVLSRDEDPGKHMVILVTFRERD